MVAALNVFSGISSWISRQHAVFSSLPRRSFSTKVWASDIEIQVSGAVFDILYELNRLTILLVSFCEEDFIVSAWIAEFANTLTNLAYGAHTKLLLNMSLCR